jgi:hypothetical protein
MPTLLCHPTTACPAIRNLEVSVTAREGGGLALGYRLTGNIAELWLPETAPSRPADELWRHTCFEAFIAGEGSPAYREFNFSPSGQWASYAFTDYRQREASFHPTVAPEIALRSFPDRLELDALLAPELLPEAASLQLGLAVVIEARDGTLSYWALKHPATQPDFHLRAGFTTLYPQISRSTP